MTPVEKAKKLVDECMTYQSEVQSIGFAMNPPNLYTPLLVQHAQNTVANLHGIRAILATVDPERAWVGKTGGAYSPIAWLVQRRVPVGFGHPKAFFVSDETDAKLYMNDVDFYLVTPLYTHPATRTADKGAA